MPGRTKKQRRRDKEELCDYPGCPLPAHVWVANDADLLSPDYAERKACRWHAKTIFD